MQRILVVYNPNSSQYIHVKSDFLSKLPKLKSTIIGKFAIEKTPFEQNVSRLKRILKDGDLVIAAGGDATAAICLNAILESDKDATLSALPYGNFNDLARTLGTMEPMELLKYIEGQNSVSRGVRSAAAREISRRPPVATGRPNGGPEKYCSALRIAKLYPLSVSVDGTHWRYASSYLTIGMTAEAVELFDEPKFRKSMQKGRKSSWRSYLALAKWYFKNRHKKTFLPDLTINGKPAVKHASDYCALSGRSMCRVMKGGDDYLKPIVFRSVTARLTSFPRLSVLMAKSILHRTPGVETTRDVLKFQSPAEVELQAEGEYKVFKNIREIVVKKPKDKCIKVIQKER